MNLSKIDTIDTVRADLTPYVKPDMLTLSPLLYFVTIYRHMHAAFAQREDARKHYRLVVETQDDLTNLNVAFWHIDASGDLELIDYTLR